MAGTTVVPEGQSRRAGLFLAPRTHAYLDQTVICAPDLVYGTDASKNPSTADPRLRQVAYAVGVQKKGTTTCITAKSRSPN